MNRSLPKYKAIKDLFVSNRLLLFKCLSISIFLAFLFAQLEHLEQIQKKRKEIWKQYYEALKPLEDKGFFKLPLIPEYATNNGHMFYLICRNEKERNELITHLKQNGIYAVFHYLSLHKSPYYKDKHDGRILPNSDRYSNCLVRLPFYYELKFDDINKILYNLNEYFRFK